MVGARKLLKPRYGATLDRKVRWTVPRRMPRHSRRAQARREIARWPFTGKASFRA